MKKFLVILMGLIVIGLCGCSREPDDGKERMYFQTGSTTYANYKSHFMNNDDPLKDGQCMAGITSNDAAKITFNSYNNVTTKRFALDELEEYLKGLGCEDEDASYFSNYLWTYKSENYVPSLAFRKGSTVYQTMRQ